MSSHWDYRPNPDEPTKEESTTQFVGFLFFMLVLVILLSVFG